jgi:hypothetical protein
MSLAAVLKKYQRLVFFSVNLVDEVSSCFDITGITLTPLVLLSAIINLRRHKDLIEVPTAR